MMVAVLPIAVGAQDFTKSYHLPIKQSHMIPLPAGDDRSHYVMAGTYGDFDRGIRFMHTDGAGNVLHNKWFYEVNNPKTCFDFTEHDGSYFITASRRGTDKDRIELIEVDQTGTILSNVLISGPGIDCIYPIHTLSYNGLLYICGYYTRGTAYPTQVTYQTSKEIFYLSYNPVTQTVVNGWRMNTYNDNTSFNPGTDYDMAVRMVPTSNGDIYITGSCNIVRPIYDPNHIPIGATNDHEYTAGTLNMLVYSNLNLNLINKPLSYPYGILGPDINIGEHGQSMVEKGGIFFNAGNYFEPDPNQPTQGFVPAPNFYHFTALDPSTLDPMGPGNESRWQFAAFDYAWGLQTLPSLIGGDVVLAGMTSNASDECELWEMKPTEDNYNPFLVDYSLGYDFLNNRITVSQNSARMYLSIYGTGKRNLGNSYHATRDWMYNNTWSANFATQTNVAGADYSTLTAPVWSSQFNTLAFKLIQGDQNGDVPSCPESYTECFPDDHHIMPVVVCTTSVVAGATPPTVNYQPFFTSLNVSVTFSQNQVENLEIETFDCAAGEFYYKQTKSSSEIDALALTTIYPNPASTSVNINLVSDAKNVKITLLDLTGRSIATLYEGDQAGLANEIRLPVLSSGVYLLKISTDSVTLPIQKLIIQ